jgi:hypothetical protein
MNEVNILNVKPAFQAKRLKEAYTYIPMHRLNFQNLTAEKITLNRSFK